MTMTMTMTTYVLYNGTNYFNETPWSISPFHSVRVQSYNESIIMRIVRKTGKTRYIVRDCAQAYQMPFSAYSSFNLHPMTSLCLHLHRRQRHARAMTSYRIPGRIRVQRFTRRTVMASWNPALVCGTPQGTRARHSFAIISRRLP
jgi:hypothetical protein